MTSKPELKYRLDDGSDVPLFEADYDMSFKVHKSDRRNAIIGDPRRCIEAKALCKLDGVLEAYIGSGKDAYVIFEGTPSKNFTHAVHFIIPASSAKVRDAFETKKGLESQILMLKVPSKGSTLQHRRKLSKARREAVKQGAAVKKREKPAKTRIHKLGVDHRPRAHVKDGVVSLFDAN